MASLRSDRDEPTVVTVGMHISGNLTSEGDVRIDGCVEGDVQSPRVLISEDGSVMGSVFADEVVIRGGVNGHVHARCVTLAETAKVALDITYIEITIEPGAEIEGSLMPVASLDQLLRIPPPRLPPPQSSAVISGSGSAVLDPVWAARPDPAPRAVPESQMSLWSGPPADHVSEPVPGREAEGRAGGSGGPKAPAFGPELVPGSASAPAFELDADTVTDEPRAGDVMVKAKAPAPPKSASFAEPAVAPAADEPPGDEKPNTGTAASLETALGFEIDAELIEEPDPQADPDSEADLIQISTTVADYIPASASYPLSDGELERAPRWRKPHVAVPITLQAREARPRRRYTALAIAALLLLVAGSGVYLGARGVFETEFGVEPVEVADAPDAAVSDGGERSVTTGVEVFALKPQERAGPDAGQTDAVQADDVLSDPEDASIQAAIDAKRKQLEQTIASRLGGRPTNGAGAGLTDTVQEAPQASTTGPSSADIAAGTAVAEAAGSAEDELSPQQQAEDYVPPETEPADAATQGAAGQVAARPGGGSEGTSVEQAIDDFKAGMAASGRDDFDETIARLSPAISSGKLETEKLAAAYRNRARAFAGKGQFDRAIDDYGETIKLRPGDASIYNSRGYIYNKKNMPREAVADISKAIKLMPGYSYAYSNRCWAYRKLGRRQEAIADCRKALELNPKLDFARKSLKRMGVEP